jgi:branched-chain amino acid transport system substrate-binding protein
LSKSVLGGLAALIGTVALVAAGCGGGGGGGGGTTTNGGGGGGGSGSATALPSSSCSAIYYEGSGKPEEIIASDLPLQGSSRAQTIEMTKAIAYTLKQAGYKAGKYTVGYQSCDDSTASAGKWDPAKCAA